MAPLVPRLVTCLKTYDRRTLLADVTAGITVGLVALPLAMAFSIASGLSPQAGIYCAVVTGFIVSALGGSRVQIAGPTGAFVVVVAGIVSKYGVDGLFVIAFIAVAGLESLYKAPPGQYPSTHHHRAFCIWVLPPSFFSSSCSKSR